MILEDMTMEEFRRSFYTFFFCGDPESPQTKLYITPLTEEQCRDILVKSVCQHAHAIFTATPEMIEEKKPFFIGSAYFKDILNTELNEDLYKIVMAWCETLWILNDQEWKL